MPITSRLVITIDANNASSRITAGPLPCQPARARAAFSALLWKRYPTPMTVMATMATAAHDNHIRQSSASSPKTCGTISATTTLRNASTTSTAAIQRRIR